MNEKNMNQEEERIDQLAKESIHQTKLLLDCLYEIKIILDKFQEKGFPISFSKKIENSLKEARKKISSNTSKMEHLLESIDELDIYT